MSEAHAAADPSSATAARRAGPARLGRLAVFAACWLALAVPYALSALWLGGSAALRGADPDTWISPLFRFNLVYITLIALLVVGLRIEARAIRRDVEALRALVVASDEAWQRWRDLLLSPSRPRLAAWIAAGALTGQLVNFLGSIVGGQRAGIWIGHYVWMGILATPLFALLSVLAALSLRRSRAFFEMGRSARVRLLDPGELAPFGRAGARAAAYWFVGSSLAMLLVLDAGAWEIVAVVNTVTLGLGMASLLLPSRGVHQSLSAARSAELARVRDEIERVRGVLLDAGRSAGDSARMAALLAWEARIERMSVWPFDAPTLLRFALFLLVPLGSWLAGALVDRAVDTLLP